MAGAFDVRRFSRFRRAVDSCFPCGAAGSVVVAAPDAARAAQNYFSGAFLAARTSPHAEQTPARTPWWLLLLRLVIAVLVIGAFAEPLIDPETALPGAGAVLIAVDNDWGAAHAWDARQNALHGN